VSKRSERFIKRAMESVDGGYFRENMLYRSFSSSEIIPLDIKIVDI